jgi:tetratricopeptide (TPR) repeat protein
MRMLTGIREMQPVFRRKLLHISLWTLVPDVVLVACLLAGVLIWAESRVRDQSPVVLAHLRQDGLFFLNERDLELDTGNADWRAGNRGAAIQEWTKVADRYGRSQGAFPALLSVARAASVQGDSKKAIAAYKKILDIPVPPPERALSPWEFRDLSQHQACVELSDLFLEQRDLKQALDYAELAHDIHKFSSPCGAANSTVQCCLQERIDAIKSAQSGVRRVVLEPRSTVLARLYGARRGPPPANPVGRVR